MGMLERGRLTVSDETSEASRVSGRGNERVMVSEG
jgi:hypothetical protein